MSTPPFTSPGCDLRDFAFMPLDVMRLRDSDFAAVTDGDEFRAGLLLWCASWHQVPAASIPDDDVVLARLAGYGRVVKEWQKVRSGALRGWVKCSDGRLYHPVVAEKANESWESKLKYAYGKHLDRIRKENKKRAESNQALLPIPSFEEWKSSGSQKEFQQIDAGIPPESMDDSAGKDGNSAGKHGELQQSGAGIPPENALKGQGQGQGNIKPSSSSNGSTTPRENPPLPPPPEPSAQAKRIGLVCRLLRSKGVACNPSQFAGKYQGLESHSDDDFHLAVQTLIDRGETSIGIGLVAAVLGDITASRQRPASRHGSFDDINYAAGREELSDGSYRL